MKAPYVCPSNAFGIRIFFPINSLLPDYARMVEKCEKDKAALEDIIGRLEALIDEKKHDGDGSV